MESVKVRDETSDIRRPFNPENKSQITVIQKICNLRDRRHSSFKLGTLVLSLCARLAGKVKARIQ